ncbi:AAA family ATPase [Polaromonas sp. SM01]|uniref:AAA family ATPase n=1 Tax=Polaromonas sp. SM01 TaxID=3085630 RepID=UPI002981E277|nr:AAA family ATPase [Polaromonas sp. SM01]MDW5443804.1 AAA family ATPase [Polaromonas sp. SM01]
MSVFHAKIEGVPQFVSYFAPVHRAMQQLGGQATPKQVYAHIALHEGLAPEDLAQVNQNGRPTFENRAAWARFYMTKAGWMYAPKHGVWALTEQGKQATEITEAQAVAMFNNVATQLKGHEEEVEAPEDHVQPDSTQYWFVGAMWGDGEGDQTPRFLQEGIWQNGYEDKFAEQVRAMKPGDRIAIKAAFARKHGTPFDNKGQTVAAMKIKATGTVTHNHGDGRTVDVAWEPLTKTREWYFYTYRATITRARVEDEVLARRLVAFTFDGAQQDYAFFMAQPYWRDRFMATDDAALDGNTSSDGPEAIDEIEQVPPMAVYGVTDLVSEGCFVPEAELHRILKRWTEKKNLILQGPPGTGKTWLAKRLAKALIGQKNIPDEQLRVVQFHPALSYEDFVRGYRPSGDGRLTLTDGLFLQVVQAAIAQPDVEHVLIIEEINRGNPAQVLGEMLTLLESSKRSRAEAMELAYSKSRGEKVYVPENLYVIGTMNVADRSLALVDLALRRRFAFVNLAPSLNSAWQQWCSDKGMDTASIAHIQARMAALNQEIAADRALGAQFQVGHSYVTPHEPMANPQAWFEEVVHSEIGPLLHEYWFDTPERANEAIALLLKQD